MLKHICRIFGVEKSARRWTKRRNNTFTVCFFAASGRTIFIRREFSAVQV